MQIVYQITHSSSLRLEKSQGTVRNLEISKILVTQSGLIVA